MYKDAILTERGAVNPLKNGRGVWVRGIGNSMTPILKNGQVVFVEPAEGRILAKGDIVLVRVKGNVYMHKITALKGQDQFQISNNHGHINGWAPRKNVYGIVCMTCI